MSMTDPIADMLTRIRNALQARKDEVEIPASRIKAEIARILKEEGYIKTYKVVKNSPQGTIRIFFKKQDGDECVIHELRKVSKPGLRVYVGADEVPRVKNGLGVAIVSTSKGILTDRDCRRQRVGGEVLCTVW